MNTNRNFSHFSQPLSISCIHSVDDGEDRETVDRTTQALDIEKMENFRLKSMSSMNEAVMVVSPWPPPSNQLNNKYFVNQVQSNLSSSNEAASDSVASATNTTVETSTVATSRAAIEANKYFVSNVSLLSIVNEAHSNVSTISPTISSKSRLKSTLNPSMATNRTKTVAHHHHHHGKTNGSTAANRTHFQIAQKQLTLSKNIRTEPPPMLNHILDSLSVSNSKHLHHDHRFVSSIILQFWKITPPIRLSSVRKLVVVANVNNIIKPDQSNIVCVFVSHPLKKKILDFICSSSRNIFFVANNHSVK